MMGQRVVGVWRWGVPQSVVGWICRPFRIQITLESDKSYINLRTVYYHALDVLCEIKTWTRRRERGRVCQKSQNER